jgi:hypothetical protein
VGPLEDSAAVKRMRIGRGPCRKVASSGT